MQGVQCAHATDSVQPCIVTERAGTCGFGLQQICCRSGLLLADPLVPQFPPFHFDGACVLPTCFPPYYCDRRTAAIEPWQLVALLLQFIRHRP
jgi:hypothetical protein